MAVKTLNIHSWLEQTLPLATLCTSLCCSSVIGTLLSLSSFRLATAAARVPAATASSSKVGWKAGWLDSWRVSSLEEGLAIASQMASSWWGVSRVREEREADCREESRQERRRGLAQVRGQCRDTWGNQLSFLPMDISPTQNYFKII